MVCICVQDGRAQDRAGQHGLRGATHALWLYPSACCVGGWAAPHPALPGGGVGSLSACRQWLPEHRALPQMLLQGLGMARLLSHKALLFGALVPLVWQFVTHLGVRFQGAGGNNNNRQISLTLLQSFSSSSF